MGTQMTNSTHEQIGKNLRALRLAKDITQCELAKAIGTSHQQVNKYERGTNAINPDRMIRIAKALNCTINDFYRGAFDDKATPFDWNSLLTKTDFNIVYLFDAIASPRQKRALLRLAKTMAEVE
jgi:transcriptional regulator with XRE-family HTH domain